MTDLLGDLTRTHTCGGLRAADVGADAVLLGWVHRVRDLGGVTFIDIRDRAGVSQIVVRENEALMATAKRLRSEFVIAVSGTVQRRSEDTINTKIATGEVEVLAREIRILSEAKTPPFSIADDAQVSEEVRLRYRYLDLRRARMQQNIGSAAPRDAGDSERSRCAGLLGNRDADPDEVDAGRRARLPGAEPRAPRRILRAAAIAAALQADPDDWRHGPLLPDRPLLPRRGSPGRSAARVHAARPRDVVRAAGVGLRGHRAAAAAGVARNRPRHSGSRFAACRTPKRSRSTDRTSPICASASKSTICPTRFATRNSVSSSRLSRRAASCGALPCPAATSTRAASWTCLSIRRKRSDLPDSSGCVPASRR